MKASFYQGGETMTLGDCVPQAPGPGEVRIDVAFCGVCGTDLHIFQGHMDKRVDMPAVIGHEMAGTIVELGPGVEEWSVDDTVVVRPLDACGECPACQAGHAHICQNLNFLGIDTAGAFQGSWTVPAHALHRVPAGLPLDLAALIEPVAVACHDVRLAGVKPGENVVVIGCGPIGMLVALVARHAGGNVLVSEVNSYRLELAREFGLEAVNPTEVDLVELVEEKTGTAGADVVFEVSGTTAGAEVMTQLPRTRGRIVVVAVYAEPAPVDLFRFFWRELQLCGVRVYEPEDFDQAIELAAADALPLERLVSARRPLGDLQNVMQEIKEGANVMKVLIDTRGE